MSARVTFYYYKEISGDIVVCSSENPPEVDKLLTWANHNVTLVFIEVEVIGKNDDIKQVDFLNGNGKKLHIVLCNIIFNNCSKDLETYCREQLSDNSIELISPPSDFDKFQAYTLDERKKLTEKMQEEQTLAMKMLSQGNGLVRLFYENINKIKTLLPVMTKYFLEMKAIIEYELELGSSMSSETKSRIEVTRQMKNKEYTPIDSQFLVANKAVEEGVKIVQKIINDCKDHDVKNELSGKLSKMKRTKTATFIEIPPSSEILKNYDYTKEIRKLFKKIITASTNGRYTDMVTDIAEMKTEIETIQTNSDIANVPQLFFPFEAIIIKWLDEFTENNYTYVSGDETDLAKLIIAVEKTNQTRDILTDLSDMLETENVISSLTKSHLNGISSRLNVIVARIRFKIKGKSTEVKTNIDELMVKINAYIKKVKDWGVSAYEARTPEENNELDSISYYHRFTKNSRLDDLYNEVKDFISEIDELFEKITEDFKKAIDDNSDDIKILRNVEQFAKDMGDKELEKEARANIAKLDIKDYEELFSEFFELNQSAENDADTFFGKDWKSEFESFTQQVTLFNKTNIPEDTADALMLELASVLYDSSNEILEKVKGDWTKELTDTAKIDTAREYFKSVDDINKELNLKMIDTESVIFSFDEFIEGLNLVFSFNNLVDEAIKSITNANTNDEFNNSFNKEKAEEILTAQDALDEEEGTIKEEHDLKVATIVAAISKSYRKHSWFIVEKDTNIYKGVEHMYDDTVDTRVDFEQFIDTGNALRQVKRDKAIAFVNQIKTENAMTLGEHKIDDVYATDIAPELRNELISEYVALRTRFHDQFMTDQMYKDVKNIKKVNELLKTNAELRDNLFTVDDDNLEKDCIAWIGFYYVKQGIITIASGNRGDIPWDFTYATYKDHSVELLENAELIKEKISDNAGGIMLNVTAKLTRLLNDAKLETSIVAIEEKMESIEKTIKNIPQTSNQTDAKKLLFGDKYFGIIEAKLEDFTTKCYRYMERMKDVVGDGKFTKENAEDVHLMDARGLCKLFRLSGGDIDGPICMHKNDLKDNTMKKILVNAVNKAKGKNILFIVVKEESYNDIICISKNGTIYAFNHIKTIDRNAELGLTLSAIATMISSGEKPFDFAYNEGENINDLVTLIKHSRSNVTTARQALITLPVDDAQLAELEKLTTDASISALNIGFEYIITYPLESQPSRSEYKDNIFDVVVGELTE